jgi:DNA polymerase-3 subunit alpha
MHAGGVLIAPGKLTDFCPIYSADGGGSVVSQYDKDDVEKVGLVKFDFLGLRNLTIIELALKYVEQLSGERPDLATLAFDDPATYQILKDGNTTAIFQVESEGMKKLVRKLAPDRFEDIIAVLALYRPGPLGSGMVDDFILRKKGQQKIDYFIDDLKTCLEPTYGVIVYQEQVMQIAQIIGGYTLGSADLLRRAMGKKKAEEMAKHRGMMRDGAKKKGYDEKLVDAAFRPDGPSSPSTASTSRTPPPTRCHLPYGLAEGAPLRGLHGGDPVVGHGQHRHGEDRPRRRAQ